MYAPKETHVAHDTLFCRATTLQIQEAPIKLLAMVKQVHVYIW